MPAEVIMPALGMAQDTGRVLRWLRSEGDAVKKGEPLLEIETDKVTVEVESPADGKLASITAAEGEDVPVGRPVAVVVADGEAAASIPARQPASNRLSQGTKRRLASPKARRIAAELGVNIDSLTGSGPNGAIVAADVETLGSGLANEQPGARMQDLTPGSAVWRTMAERTQRAWQEVPHFYLRREVDASRLNSWRAAAQTKVSHTDLLVKIAAEALRRHPRVNNAERINVAIAVATEDGLVAPVVHDADRLELAQIAERRAEIVVRAREHRLRPEDVSGGTFTVSNLGMYGVDSFDAIVNAPQAAILAVGRIHDRVVAIDGAPAVRPVLELSISFDHRVVDGARGAEFLDTLVSLIEEPAGLVR